MWYIILIKIYYSVDPNAAKNRVPTELELRGLSESVASISKIAEDIDNKFENLQASHQALGNQSQEQMNEVEVT